MSNVTACLTVVYPLSFLLTTNGRIFNVGVLYERYIYGKQMCEKNIFVGATPRAHEPVLHSTDFFEKIK